ncbi:MAG: transaldolase [Thiobacillaceae bacterium]|nr:transaldolase [Thiobacillaceae bacterium]MDW8323991.1 transaldolase [Burkholderiales bacterium]
MKDLTPLRQIGQSIWLDNLSRSHLREGELQRLIGLGVSGVTSNPTIFHKAVSDSPHYRADLERLRHSEPDPERRYEALVTEDIRAACDLLRPMYEASGGDDGYVSLEVAPRHAYDTEATVAEAQRLSVLVARDNLLVKVPGTPQGVAAFERLTALGVKVNVTLLFSLNHVVRIFEAYIRGARAWLDAGGEPARLKAVASLFLSRVDTLVDQRLDALATPEAMQMRGKTAVAMARLAYQRYKDIFQGPAFAELRAAGVRPQYLLWASTGTKNPAYSDLLYVEPLIGPQTINTLPDKTLQALLEHGRIAPTLEEGLHEAEAHMVRLEHLGILPVQLGEQLQADGVRLFAESYDRLIALMH